MPRIVPALAVLLLALAAACGDGSGSDDARILEVGSVAEEAVYAYAGDGPAGLYAFLAPQIQAICSRDAFEQALAGRDQPTGFRALKGVKFEGEEARATVILIVRDHDEEVEWVFVPNPEGVDPTWFLAVVPGLQECR